MSFTNKNVNDAFYSLTIGIQRLRKNTMSHGVRRPENIFQKMNFCGKPLWFESLASFGVKNFTSAKMSGHQQQILICQLIGILRRAQLFTREEEIVGQLTLYSWP